MRHRGLEILHLEVEVQLLLRLEERRRPDRRDVLPVEVEGEVGDAVGRAQRHPVVRLRGDVPLEQLGVEAGEPPRRTRVEDDAPVVLAGRPVRVRVVRDPSAHAGDVTPSRPPVAGLGTPRRWPATSTGRSSSAATGSATRRRTRWCRSSRSTPPAGRRRGRRPGSTSPSRDSPTICSATLPEPVHTCRCRCSASWSEICGVIGCRASRPLRPPTTAETSPASPASKTGRSSRCSLRSSMQSRSAARSCSPGRPSRYATSPSTSERSAFSSAAAASAYRMKSTFQSYGAAGSGRTVVIRCTAKVRTSSLRWSCAVRLPPSSDIGSTTRSLLAPWLSTYPITTVVAGLDRLAQRGHRAGRGEPVGGHRGSRGLGAVAGPDRADDLAGVRGLPDGALRAAAVLLRRARPEHVGPGDVDGAVGGLDDGRDAEVAQPREQYVDRRGADQDGRRQPAQPERRGLRVVQQLDQRRLVVGAQERLGVADPHRAERAGGVVDQVGQRLRHRRTRHRPDEVVHLDRRPAGVERPPYRPGREPVDRRAAARLDVGDQLQLAGQLRLQRTGRDRRQVGLEQHVVDRRRAAAR